MKPYYVELENTIEELEELFITRYMELMECDREWAMEVQKNGMQRTTHKERCGIDFKTNVFIMWG
ncbi:hypothetical protein [Enterococcus phage vB_EfaS_Ef5.1]|nr:hypothetical protein [Enterococcus phage vB_EfaS_Ef5.1]